jgi:hypothetical protein
MAESLALQRDQQKYPRLPACLVANLLKTIKITSDQPNKNAAKAFAASSNSGDVNCP